MTAETRFIQDGGNVNVVTFNDDALLTRVPPAVYRVEFSMFGPYLSKLFDKFEVPEHLFGDTTENVQRLMRRYKKRGEVSALLTGQKGCGKTLLSHVFANKALDNGTAVIVVDEQHDPAPLKDFLLKLGNVVLIFDEYRKTFKDKQNEMLDLFSGACYTKRATFVIENREYDVNEFMLERPGRLLFHFRYGKLSINTVKEVCAFRKVQENITDYIIAYAARVTELGMDTLNKIIDEALFDSDVIKTQDDFNDLLAQLNIPPCLENNTQIKHLKIEGKMFEPEEFKIRESYCGDNDQMEIILPSNMNHPVHQHLKEQELGWYDNQLEDDYIHTYAKLKFQDYNKKVFANDKKDIEVVTEESRGKMDKSHLKYLV